MKSLKNPIRAIAIGLGALSASSFAGTLTLDLTNVVPQSPLYSGHAGTDDFGPDITGLQYFTVTAQSGNSFAFPSQLQLFCIELSQNIWLPSTGNFFDVVSADQGSKGVHSGLSANISLAGIDPTRASTLEVLYAHVFGTNYDPITALSPAFYAPNPATLLSADQLKLSFQLAVWELSHDDDFNLLSGSGNGFWITSPVDASITEAQALVTWVGDNASTAPKMELYALHSDSIQDFLVPIPEPSTYALLTGIAVMSFAAWRRKVAVSVN